MSIVTDNLSVGKQKATYIESILLELQKKNYFEFVWKCDGLFEKNPQ